MDKATSAIRIRKHVHKAAREYAFKSEITVVDLIDAAVLWYINEFPIEKKSKPKSSKK